MKNPKFMLGICVMTVLTLFWAGCAKPPVAEMEAAESAVIRAENDSDAVIFAGSTLARARDALNRMRDEANAKRYDAAKNYAAEAVAAAGRAISDGRAGAARARDEAANLLASVKVTLEETGQAIESAKTVNNIDLDFNTVDKNFDQAQRTTDQAEVSLAGNDFQESMEKSRTARGILGDISTEISGAAIASSRKK